MAPPAQIVELLGKLTLDEKVALLAGKNMWETTNIDRVGIRSLKMTDGPAGVRGVKWTLGAGTTLVPCGTSLAATFDPEMVNRIGQLLGAETRSKHAHLLLAPTINMSRSPFGGRNFENFGEDPFLTGVMATSIVRGIQSQGVGACIKHYVANEQESRRFNIDEQIDERTLREVYLRPFQMAMNAYPWSVMTSYNKVNGEHVDTSQHLMQEILRKEWDFDGLTISDWGGLNDTVQSVLAGTDLEMPGPPVRRGEALSAALKEEKLLESDIDPCVERILCVLDKAGLIADQPRSMMDEYEGIEESMDSPEFRALVKEAAVGGMVLLKNNGILPMSAANLKSIAVVGPNSKTPTAGGSGSAGVNPYYVTNPLDSIRQLAKLDNAGIEILYEKGILTHKMLPLLKDRIMTPEGDTNGFRVDFYHGHSWAGDVVGTKSLGTTAILMFSDEDLPEALRKCSALEAKPYSFRCHGVVSPLVSGSYLVGLSSTGKSKLYIDDELVLDNSQWTQLGEGFMNCNSSEIRAQVQMIAGRQYRFRVDQVAVPPPLPPHDNTLFHTLSGVRVGMLPPEDQEAMFKAAVEKARKAEIAVLIVGHNNDTEREGSDRTTLDLPGKTEDLILAVCRANPNTVVVNQSACPVSMYRWKHAPAAIIQAWYQGQENGNALAEVLFGKRSPGGKLPITFPVRIEDHPTARCFPGDVENDFAEYKEGVMVGYRWFDERGTEPLWPFGYGLTYTKFDIIDAKVETSVTDEKQVKVSIFISIENTGDMEGQEVLQAYISSSPVILEKGLDDPIKKLAGFSKVSLMPGSRAEAKIEFGSAAFEWYDTEIPGWRIDPGLYKVYIGTSSRDITTVKDISVEF